MHRVARISVIGMAALCLALTASACSKNTESGKEQKGSEPVSTLTKEPATLNIFLNQSMSDEEFQRLVVEPVKKKYPHITLTFSRPGTNSSLANLITSGQTPDIIYYSPYLYALAQYDLLKDIRPLMQKYSVNLSSFDPLVVDLMQRFAPSGEVYSLPFVKNTSAMFYNKELFDKFGQAYPKDGMTWEDTIELAKKVTRSVDGTPYRGLDPHMNGAIHNFAAPLSLRLADAATNKAYIDDKWKSVFQLAMDMYAIPGNRPAKIGNPLDDFLKNQVLAMFPAFYSQMQVNLPAVPQLNWDVVQLPAFREKPNTAYQIDYHQFVIAKSSKYPEQAMQAIHAILSEETAVAAARVGRIPAVKLPQLEKEFGAEVTVYKGKNIAGIFKSSNAVAAPQYQYDDMVRSQINRAFTDVFNGTVDINTALRQAEERANQAIAAELEKAGQKK
ncbi:MAG: family 1 extracellular solute-binding protein [Paenibacillus sp.]|jgi:multiple sugar transport system substrate-binding protein|nr:family 1 extracellular solute-binding protein [Paenibacillus sp.]